jgi:hypothetical protein
MATKRFSIFFLFLFITGSCFCQFEEQRKYQLSKPDSVLKFIKSSGQLSGFSTYNHSEDTYFDLYLDTPDFSLAENHLSLRFRKRKFSSTLPASYGFQLKSEMENAGGLRMEVEETDLSIYRVQSDKGWIPLKSVLDIFFSQAEENTFLKDSPEIVQATQQLQSWIRMHAGGPVIPFQKISHLELKGLDAKSLQTLTPVMCGMVKRLRSHIFINPKTSPIKNIPQNPLLPDGLPYFFIENNYNWVLESSLDYASFYPLIEAKIPKVELCELEVENKYAVKSTGTELMNIFEKGLKEKFGVTNGMDSKYLQSLKKFRGQ